MIHWISKLFIDSIHILFLLYLLVWFGFSTSKPAGFHQAIRALIKDIFLVVFPVVVVLPIHQYCQMDEFRVFGVVELLFIIAINRWKGKKNGQVYDTRM